MLRKCASRFTVLVALLSTHLITYIFVPQDIMPPWPNFGQCLHVERDSWCGYEQMKALFEGWRNIIMSCGSTKQPCCNTN